MMLYLSGIILQCYYGIIVLVSDQLLAFNGISAPTVTHERCSAEDLGLKESWFRDVIYECPEVVIGPCRAAGLTDDEWYSWR